MTPQSDSKHYLQIEEETFDFKKIFFQVLANWYWFVISVFVGLFIAYLVNRYSEPVFSIHSSILIEGADGRKYGPGVQALMREMNLNSSSKRIENEIGILKSYSIAYKTVEELQDFHITYVSVGRREIKESKLYNRGPFVVEFDSTSEVPYGVPFFLTFTKKDEFSLETAIGELNGSYKFGDRIKTEKFSFIIKPREDREYKAELVSKKFYFIANNLNNLAKAYQGKVKIELNNEKGSILTLTSVGFVAEQEADYLNKLMEVYIRQSLEEKNRTAENTVRFIDSQLNEISDSLKHAEQQLLNFRVSNRVIDISAEGSLLFEKLKTLQQQKATNELNRRYYEYLKGYIKSKADLRDIVAPNALGIDDIQLASILNEINSTYIQREELLLTTMQGSIVLQQVDNRLENYKKTLQEKANSLLDANKLVSTDIDKQIADLETEMIKLPVNERQLINIEREFNLMDKIYTYLLEKRAEAAIARASNTSDNKVLDSALPFNAAMIKPNRKSNYLLAIIIGLAIPVIIIVLINYLNTKITDISEIGKYTKTPILGSVGHNKFTSNFPVFDKPKSTLTESFRAVRTNLQFILRNPNQKVITVTSTVSGEGKTFIASNLAAIISLNSKKVLLIGLDLRKPKLQNYFEQLHENGLSTFLIGRDKPEDVVYKSDHENLFYVPSGPIPPNPAELISSERMQAFIDWGRKNFDYIILDTPPIAIVTDALLTQRFSDMVLFVVRFNYSNKMVLKLVEGLKQTGECDNVSLIVNDLQHRRIYGYAYAYNYGYSYGYSYGSSYGYGKYKDAGGYYTDDDMVLSWWDKIKRLF